MQLTQGDINKILEEINYRKTELGPALRERLKVARAQGDLSENFEYTMAKRENNQNNSRVRYLENIVRTAEIIEENDPSDVVGLNKEVTVYYVEDDEEDTFKFVSSIRGNSMEGRLSLESPIGRALKGHKVGDTVHIRVSDAVAYDVEIRKIVAVPDDGSDNLRQF